MFARTPSQYLQRILDAVQRMPRGLAVLDEQPDAVELLQLATELGEDPDDVYQALMGLRAGEYLMEERLEFPGIAPAVWWVVHPQCRR